MVCFSCGWSGHGVSRCPRIDIDFPFLLPGWLVEHRAGLAEENAGMASVGKRRLIREGGGGSASRISDTSRFTDPGGGS